jgi:hypothetical protein
MARKSRRGTVRGQGGVVTRVLATAREVTDITYEGVTYSLVTKGKAGACIETCPVCGGTGWMYSRKCKECHGRGLIHTAVSSAART